MAYLCDICGKKTVSGNNVSHSKRRTKRKFAPNLRPYSLYVDGIRKQFKLCTRCIRTIKHKTENLKPKEVAVSPDAPVAVAA